MYFIYFLVSMLNIILGVFILLSLSMNWDLYANQVEYSIIQDEYSILEYNDSFVALVKECTDANLDLYENFNTEDWASIEDIETAIQNNINICQKSMETVLKIWDYNNDSSLKDVVVELLELELDYLDKFSRTTNYRDEDNISDEDKLNYDSIVTELNNTKDLLNQKFEEVQNVQNIFAEKYWLELE